MTDRAGRVRVLLVIAGLPIGGAERQMALLCKNLDRARYDVGLLIFNAAEKVHYRDALTPPLWFRALSLSRSRHRGLALRVIRGIANAVCDFRPDIVHSTLNAANHAVRISSLVYGWRCPIVSSVRADYRLGYSRRERILERILWRRSRHVICNSERTRGQLIEDVGMPPARVSTVANGIDEAFFSETAMPPPWWPDGRVALVVGRYKAEKNHLVLLDAIADLNARGVLHDWTFVFLGEGPMRQVLVETIDRLNLRGRVILAAPVLHMPPVYRSAQLLVMPSLFEGMPNAALEAQAAGCPVIISEQANGASIIDDGSGWIVSCSLTESLESALRSSPEELQRKGHAGRQKALERYSVAAMMARTERVYDGVLRRDRS